MSSSTDEHQPFTQLPQLPDFSVTSPSPRHAPALAIFFRFNLSVGKKSEKYGTGKDGDKVRYMHVTIQLQDTLHLEPRNNIVKGATYMNPFVSAVIQDDMIMPSFLQTWISCSHLIAAISA